MKKIGWGRSPDGHEKPVVPDIPTPTLINSNTDALLLGERVDLTSWSDPQNIAGTIISDIILVFNKTSSISQKELVVKGILMPLVWNSAPPEEDPNYQYLSTRHIQKMGDYLYTASHGSQDRAIYRFGWINLYYMPIWFSTPIDPENPPWIVSNNAGVFKSESSLYKVLSWVNIEDLLGEQSWDWKDYLNIAVQRYDLEEKISFSGYEGIGFLDSFGSLLYFSVNRSVYYISEPNFIGDNNPSLRGYVGDLVEGDTAQITGEESGDMSGTYLFEKEDSVLLKGMINNYTPINVSGQGYLLGKDKTVQGIKYKILQYYSSGGPPDYGIYALADISFGNEGENKLKFGNAVLQYDKLHYNAEFPKISTGPRTTEHSYQERGESHYIEQSWTNPSIYCPEMAVNVHNAFLDCVAKAFGSWSAWVDSGTAWLYSMLGYYMDGNYFDVEGWNYIQRRNKFKIRTTSLVSSLNYPIKEQFLDYSNCIHTNYYRNPLNSPFPYDLVISGTVSFLGKEIAYQIYYYEGEPVELGTQDFYPRNTNHWRLITNWVDDYEYYMERDLSDKGIVSGCKQYSFYASRLGLCKALGYPWVFSGHNMLHVIRQDWNEIKYISSVNQEIDLSAWGSRFIDVSN
jgi:hypothetical protein